MKCGYIAIIGRANVGKSTLLNHLLGQKIAIVSAKPQTTRTRILGILSLPEAQMLFLDTPGIHRGGTRLNRRMVQAALGALVGADLCLYLFDASQPTTSPDEPVVDRIRRSGIPTIAVVNKIDLIKKDRMIPLLDRLAQGTPFTDIVPISAMTGHNVDRLLEVVSGYLPEGDALYPEDQVTDVPLRTLASEFIREKILDKTRQEIPHAVAVALDRYEEDPEKGLARIHATIYVERESQKGIVIGKEGAMLKAVGHEARLEIERVSGMRVYLELWVKVMKGWRDDESMLDEFGY